MTSLSDIPEDGSHPCEKAHCSNIVPYDDEPYCFVDSAMSGSHIPGYSYALKHAKTTPE